MLLIVGVGSWSPVGLVVRMPYAEPSGWHAGKTLPIRRQCARVPKIIGVFILQSIQRHVFKYKVRCMHFNFCFALSSFKYSCDMDLQRMTQNCDY